MILLAIGLVLVAEGLVYALAPSIVERLLATLRDMPLDQRRLMGLASIAVGVLFIWIAKATGL